MLNNTQVTYSPLIVALDYAEAEPALAMAAVLDPVLTRVKVGKQLFTREGPGLVDALHALGFEVFLDLKFHDIPNTVAGAVEAAADMGVWMVNVHASGGSRMMRAAMEALENKTDRPLLIAVTVLTSMDQSDLLELGITETPAERVSALAKLSELAGLDGVVCSAQEAAMLSRQCAKAFLRVTPGIRLAGDDAGDQRRVVTPDQAMTNGASYLVMGRSITHAADPAAALTQVLRSISAN